MKKIVMKTNTKEGVFLSKLFEQFIKFKECDNLSDFTLQYYQDCYTKFLVFLQKDILCSDIDLSLIQDYILYLKKQTVIKDTTVNTKLRGLRAIIYYGISLGYIKEFKIKLIRVKKEVKEVYTNEELALLLKKPNLKKCRFTEYRSWVISNYLLATGNRLSTVISIKIQDVDFRAGEIILRRTKNKKEQIIPLSRELSKILREYLTHREGEPEDYLFCTIHGEKLAPRSLQDQIEQYNHSRGVMKTSIHTYRRTFAKLFLLNGGDIFRLQKLLGHSSLEMVREYVDIFSDELKINYSSFNPLDNLVHSQGEKIQMK